MALSVTVHGFMTLTGTQTAGRWGTANIVNEDGSDTVVYTVPSVGVDYMILAVSITNRAPVTASDVSVAVSSDVTPKSFEFIEYQSSLVPSGTLERTQIVASPGDKIFVRWGVPTPRNELRIIDSNINNNVFPMGLTLLPDSTLVAADQVAGSVYLRKITPAGTETASAQYTTGEQMMFARNTSTNLDVTAATVSTDTFYEFSDALVNTQNEGFVYGGGLGYESMTLTDFRIGGASDGTNTYDIYKTQNDGTSSQLYAGTSTAGDIETGISVVWPGDSGTGRRVKLFTLDNGSDTIISVGYADQGGTSVAVLWTTAFDNTNVDWESFVAVGNVLSPSAELIPVGVHYWQGSIWILTSVGRLVELDPADGSVLSERTLEIQGNAAINWGSVNSTPSGHVNSLFTTVANTMYFTATQDTVEQYKTWIVKVTLGGNDGVTVQYCHEVDTTGDPASSGGPYTGVYVPRFLNATTDRVYLQMQADYSDAGGPTQYHSYLYDLLDDGSVPGNYSDSGKIDTITPVTATVTETSAELDHNNNEYTILYPTDITGDEVDVATSPLVAVDPISVGDERLVTISPPAP